jgi:hypothetical protein
MVFFALIGSGCRDQNDEFIQGMWVFANEYEVERSGPAHLFYIWQFGNGSFYNEQTVGATRNLYGNYRIINSGDGYLELELYNLEGTIQHVDTSRLSIKIDYEKNQIRIGRTLFYRRTP